MTDLRLTLDHVGLVARDLRRARDAYARLGFALTRRSVHKGQSVPGGPVEPWGTGNHCAMFRDGYLELLGIVDPTRPYQHLAGRLKRYAGWHIVALGCDSADRAAEALRHVVPGPAAPTELHRDVPYGDGTRPGAFRLVHLPDGTVPEATLFFIEHRTPEVLWQPDLLDQPNGVVALDAVVIASAEPEATGDRLCRLLRRDLVPADGLQRFPLDRGAVEIGDAAALQARYPGVAPPTLPWVAAARFQAADLDAARRLLAGNGVSRREGAGRLWVPPEAAAGGVVEFVAA